MKKSIVYRMLFLIFINLIIINTSRSQVLISLLLGDVLNSGGVEFGLTGGANMSWIDGQENDRHLTTLNIGFYFDIRMKNQWYLYTGVLVKANLGASSLTPYSIGNQEIDTLMQAAKVDRRLKYFNVPIMIKYRTKMGIYFKGGLQLGLLQKAHDIFKEKIIDKEDLQYTYDITDEVKRIDAGFSAGLGYKFQKGIGVNIGTRYYYGLVDIYKNNNQNGKNSSIYFFVDIPIGANKSKKNDTANNELKN